MALLTDEARIHFRAAAGPGFYLWKGGYDDGVRIGYSWSVWIARNMRGHWRWNLDYSDLMARRHDPKALNVLTYDGNEATYEDAKEAAEGALSLVRHVL